MSNFTKLILAAGVFSLAAAPLKASYVSDGGFESPAEPGNNYYYNAAGGAWTFSSTSGIIQPPSAFGTPNSAPEGIQYAFLQTNHGDGHYNGVTEGLATESITLPPIPASGHFTFSDVEAIRSGQTNAAYEVLLGTTVIGASHSASANSFNAYSFDFTAPAGTYTLSLLSTGPTDSTTFVDEVGIVAVPEPASLGLLGLGGLGLLARRRRA